MNPSPSTYTPQPGTIAARALAHIMRQPPDEFIANGVLCEALEQPASIVICALEAPAKYGLVVREKREGRVFWRRGSGAVLPLPPADVDEPDDEAPVQRVVKASRHDGVALLDIPRFPGVVVQSAPAKAEPPAQSAPRGAPRGATGPHALKPLDWLSPPAKPMHAPSSSLPFPDPDAAFEDAPPQKPQGRDSQQVLKAEASGPDATDCETPANTSPGGGPMGAGQPAAAGPAGGVCAPAALVCHNGTPREPLTWDNSTAIERMTKALGITASPPAPMRCTVWSDGTLAIEKDGRTQTYSPEETRALVRYLERMVVEEGAEC